MLRGILLLFVQEAFSQAQRNNYNQTVKACVKTCQSTSQRVKASIHVEKML